MPDRPAPVVGCISLEPWDDVWRRNQHFAHQLVAQGLAARIVFVEPPVLGRRPRRFSPEPGIDVVRPFLPFLKRYGGLAGCGRLLGFGVLKDVDVLWVNDPQLGVHCLRTGLPAVYDVTDDWRAFDNPPHIRDRIVAAEDVLARHATTVVCSQVLADRWHQRYGVTAPVVQNGVDLDAFARAKPVVLQGEGPHLGYVGTLHATRLDVRLVLELADLVGDVHLIGPDCLDSRSRTTLSRHRRVHLQGPVPASTVPDWLMPMDVLICPHLVNDFTLSLDAIKAHEFAATGLPVVATPTSGFQHATYANAKVAQADAFVPLVQAALSRVKSAPPRVSCWDERARDFVSAWWV